MSSKRVFTRVEEEDFDLEDGGDHLESEQNRFHDDHGNSSSSSSWIGKFVKEKSTWIGFVSLIVLVCVAMVLGFVVYQVWNKPQIGSDDAGVVVEDFNKTVIMVSLDGFRPDYLEMFEGECGNLSLIISNGVRAASMTPIFPSKTFPNHYTLVTGLYAESHGIISNTYVVVV